MTSKRKMKRSTLVLIILAVVVVIAGVVAYKFKGDKTLQVTVDKVETHDVTASVSEAGTIQPRTELKIAPDVSGEIVALNVREGQKVKKGDDLVTIRPDSYESAMEQARAALNAASANHMQALAASEQARANYLQDSTSFARADQLYKEGVTPKVEWEAAKLKLEVSKAQLRSSKQSAQAAYYQKLSSAASLKQARQNLDRTSIAATMDGTVTQLNVELGERVVGTIQMAGTEMLRVADLSQMEVVVEINENDIVDLRVGDSTKISVDAFEEIDFFGKVTDIAYSASTTALTTSDQVTNFEVKVEIDPKSYKNDPKLMRGGVESPFRPGMSAQVDIYTETQTGVIAVPIQAVTTWKNPDAPEGNRPDEVVFVLSEGNTVKRTTVKTGISDDRNIVILEGLKGGETIVTGPYLTLTRDLTDGSTVEIQGPKD